MGLTQNVSWKKNCYDKINEGWGVVLFRSIQGTVSNTINFALIKYLPMTIVSIVNNLAPMMTVILAYYFLKEKLKSFEIIMLGFVLAGITVVVLGGNDKEDVDPEN